MNSAAGVRPAAELPVDTRYDIVYKLHGRLEVEYQSARVCASD
jgi:hypothetical protein